MDESQEIMECATKVAEVYVSQGVQKNWGIEIIATDVIQKNSVWSHLDEDKVIEQAEEILNK